MIFIIIFFKLLQLQLNYCYSDEIIRASNLIIDGETITIGQSCKRDYQCIKNAYCRLQKTCWCDETYTHDSTMSICHATVGTNCNKNNDCKTMSNAECIQDSCECMNNYFLDINNSSNCIIRPKKSGDYCQRNDECIEALSIAHCVNEKCKCNYSYKFANEIGKCIKAKGIYQSCKYNYECYDEIKPNDLQCLNGECIYKDQVASSCDLKFTIYLLILQIGLHYFTVLSI